MNPDYVLPIFLGACLAGMCIWNIVLSGQKDRLSYEVERLMGDLTTAVTKIPNRDASGKFRKKA